MRPSEFHMGVIQASHHIVLLLLCTFWFHSVVFRYTTTNRYLYSLCSVCFTKAELRRLDGFQAKCLRSILRVLPSHLSRVSNASVLQKAACSTWSTLLLGRQTKYLGKVLRSDEANPIRASCLVADTSLPITSLYIRNVGRPRKEWLTTVRHGGGIS